MKLDIDGDEMIAAPIDVVWGLLNDPDALTACIPGCKSMTLIAPDAYKLAMQLKVASVSGSFDGEISLSEKTAPSACRIGLAGGGTLGHAKGEAGFALSVAEPATTRLTYQGTGEIGGLVAGVGQRILKGVAKHLIGQFFKEFRKLAAAKGTISA